MSDILDYLGKEFLFYDGATGTYLQSRGLKAGELPEIWNLTCPEEIIRMHQGFLEAGSNILLTNTFGANPGKLSGSGYELDEIITAATANAREAVRRYESTYAGTRRPLFISLDIGPCGHLMKPYGDMSFDEAYEWFRQIVCCGVRSGVDLITIETMSDTYEVKAALLAAKENSDLPVFVTMTYDEGGRLLTGGEIPGTVALLEGLGADAIGMNCGLGPEQMEKLADRLLEYASVPVIVNPNAGLPRVENGETVYDIGPEKFAEVMERLGEKGVCVLGGCCGTTAEYISEMVKRLNGRTPLRPKVEDRCLVTSYSQCVQIGRDPVIIGERINPTGRKWLKKALQEDDTDRILQEALKEQDEGAQILDVNAGLPGIDEAAKLRELIPAIQAVTDLPIQIDTSSAKAMDQAMRVYNGIPMVNSVNGRRDVMEAVFPLVKKYGGVVVGLCLDEDGIPSDSEGRLKIARRILDTASSYGIPRKNIVIDALTLTISADSGSANVTLETLRRLRDELQVPTVLGVSNISFGLPAREVVNSAFFTMALQNGLSCCIINPGSQAMRDSYDAYRALSGIDQNCGDFIARNAGRKSEKQTDRERRAVQGKASGDSESKEDTLSYSIEKGLSGEARSQTELLLLEREPLDIINEELIPALDIVGQKYEKGTLFLPQLLMSADAAGASFDVIRDYFDRNGQSQEKKGRIVIATVKGDIHDIGKNIVKALLQNYGYDMIDLGKDVDPEKVVEAARDSKAPLVGLSALMTTTVVYMEETIRLIHEELPGVKVMVGGAVLNPEYASRIGADFYGVDAMASVRYAESLYEDGFFTERFNDR